MTHVYMTPLPSQAEKDTTNAINQIILELQNMLPKYGWEVTEDPGKAELFAGHAGIHNAQYPIDVAHCHGLYPTYYYPNSRWTFQANRQVIDALRAAKSITVPSQWVADLLRRDMHIDPYVIGWGVHPEEWADSRPEGQVVLWNKTRDTGVCTPEPMNLLARKLPEVKFVSTFGEPAPNVTLTGLLPRAQMMQVIKSSHIYLATTLETWGIATLEALAAGLPVLGFDWGGTADIVQHKVTGYLVRPGDIEGLVRGYKFITDHWAELSEAAREQSKRFSWAQVANSVAQVYGDTHRLQQVKKSRPTISVVVPCHNYGHYLSQCLRSVQTQDTTVDFELIVVLDRCTDNSNEVAQSVLRDHNNFHLNHEEVLVGDFGNPADTRNYGISKARGQYILCLDADDYLIKSSMLETLYQAFNSDPYLGIAYSRLALVKDGQGEGDLKVGPWPNNCDPKAHVEGANQVPTCCMFKREAWVRAGGYRRKYVPAEDAHLWASMMVIGYEARLVMSEPGFAYRLHPNSLSSSIRTRARIEPNWGEYLLKERTQLASFASVVPTVEGLPTHPVKHYFSPKVSIIIPVGPSHIPYLSEALDSVKGQTEWNWECLVVNDTGGALSPFLKPYPWVKIISPTRSDLRFGNPGIARNAGIDRARGRYLVFLDADDYLEPTFLEETYKKFRETGRYVYTDWKSISSTGKVEMHRAPEYDPNLLFKNGAIHAVTVFVPRIDVLDVHGFPEDIESWEDMVFFMRLAKEGLCGTHLDRPLFTYRYPTGTMRNLAEDKKVELKAKVRAQFGPELEGSQLGTMDCCGQPKRVESVKPHETGGMVRVKYGGMGVPASEAPLRGAETRTYYGEKKAGDIFMVWKADYNTMQSVFQLYHEVEAEDVRRGE